MLRWILADQCFVPSARSRLCKLSLRPGSGRYRERRCAADCRGVVVGSYAVLLPITFCLTPAGQLCGSKEFSRDYAWNRAVGTTGRHRLFGMPFEQWLVAAPAPLRSVRTCRLLRLLSLPTRLRSGMAGRHIPLTVLNE